MKKPVLIRIMIVEEQRMVRTFFERWLVDLPRFTLVASTGSAEEALMQIEAVRPDIMLMDYPLPGMDGPGFMRSARQIRPQLRVLIVSSLLDPLFLTRIREAGIEGYVEKNASPEVLADALEAIADGGEYYSQKFREIVACEGAQSESIGKILSRREQQVLDLILTGKTNRGIGELMSLSTRTVEFHRANLMAKLNARNLPDLVATAQLRGWSSKC